MIPPNIFIPGKITFLLDAPAGSSGKGKLASFITKHAQDVHFLVTSNSPNASHRVIDNVGGNDVDIIFKVLPSGSLYHEKLDKVFISSGAIFDIASLMKEIELTGIPRSKVRIHPRAGIATPIDAAYERGECDLDGNFHQERQAGTLKTGTTASGSGTVLAKKVLRHKTLVTAKDCPELKDMICVIEEEILELLSYGKSGLFEIGQGFPLSNNYWRFAPNTTSRNVTVSAALNDAFLPPNVVGNVIINTRTFPIRINSKKYISKATRIEVGMIAHPGSLGQFAETLRKKGFECEIVEPEMAMLHGDSDDREKQLAAIPHILVKPGKFLTWDEVQSGIYQYEVIDSYSGDWYPDQKEISWEEVEVKAGIQIPQLVKNTTLTKLPRRVATFSQINLDEAIKYNQTNGFVFVSINFINFVDGDMEGAKKSGQLTSEAEAWIRDNVAPVVLKYNNAKIAFIGTSEKTDDFITY